MDIKKLLTFTVEQKASDLHLTAGLVPLIRKDGDLQVVEGAQAIDGAEMDAMLQSVLSPERIKQLPDSFEMDLSVALPGVARFRVNIFHTLVGLSAVFRAIPFQVPTLKELGLSDTIRNLCQLPQGLVLVTGPTGTGKSTTLAAMIEHINSTEKDHIVTIEDPIEFVYNNNQCLIHQREVHEHTKSFNDALRSVLREDPDIILVGEMRDLETIRLALTAAETGHLVFATLHTGSAATTIHRVIDVFPGDDKPLVRSMLADTLQAVVSQILVKRKGGGRLAAQEIMMCNPAIRNLIREDKIPQIYTVIQTNRALGMQTMEQHLQELKNQGLIAE